MAYSKNEKNSHSTLKEENMEMLKGSGSWMGGLESMVYYYNRADDSYYMQPRDLIGGKGAFIKVVPGSNNDKDLRKRYPRGSNEYGADYNPILEKKTTINPRGTINVPLAPNNASIRFPNDMLVDAGEDYVMFDFYDYKPPFQGKVTPDNQVVNETLKQYNATGFAAEFFKDKAYPQIIMYMPQDIQDQFAAKWEGKKFGNLTTGIVTAAGQEKAVEKLEKLGQTMGSTLKRGSVEAAASVVTGLAQSITGDSISANDLFGGISGVARNPNAELLFQSMEMRTFDLSFKMAPFDARDVESMTAIHKVFKMAMLPQYSLDEGTKVFGQKNGSLQGGFIQVPKVCAVNFMRGSSRNEFLPAYKMCAITDVNINYTPDGVYATFDGSSPVATELKVSFMETKLVFSEDIQERGF